MVNADGSRAIIQSKFHRGEVSIYNSLLGREGWPVDGYAETDHGVKCYEFHGERFHTGCPHCQPGVRNYDWERKKRDILRLGYVFDVIWECEWNTLVRDVDRMDTPLLHDILKKNQKEADIVNGIRSERLFGFILCDIESPPDVIEKMRDFPPIITRQAIDESNLSPFMKEQIKLEHPELKKFKRETLVQCFSAKNHLIMTPLAKFYLDRGLIITNITKFMQYVPNNCISPFVEHVTSMRIDAERNNLPTKGNTAKIFGNSGYGKVPLVLFACFKINFLGVRKGQRLENNHLVIR